MKNGIHRTLAGRGLAFLLSAALLSAPVSHAAAAGGGTEEFDQDVTATGSDREENDWFESSPPVREAEPPDWFGADQEPLTEPDPEPEPVPAAEPVTTVPPDEPERNAETPRRRTVEVPADEARGDHPDEPEEPAEPENTMPTLIRNDEAWYKDAVEPLLLRDGEPYVPVDFFGMFEKIAYSVPKDGNLLLSNSVTGAYVSILTDDGSSAVNGEIGDTVGVFQDGTVWYAEARPVCAALGLGMETIDERNGVPSLRITDGNERLTTPLLIASLAPETPAGQRPQTVPQIEPAKRLFIFCTSPEENTEYSIEAELERFGMNCTVFLWHDATLPEMLAGQSYGAYGVATTDEENTAGGLAEANRRIREMTGRRTRWTITTQDPVTDGALREAGFCPITPDFTVTSLTALDTMMADLEGTLDVQNEVSVFLTDCWKGTVAVSLLRALLDNHPDWAETNLGG